MYRDNTPSTPTPHPPEGNAGNMSSGASRILSFEKGLRHAIRSKGRVVVLCGDEMQREAGLPAPGPWTIGATEYSAASLATRVTYKRMWWAVWEWYAHRAGQALAHDPASVHRAVVDLLSLLGSRCTAVSLSTDGLLKRAAADAVDEGNLLFNPQLVELNGNVTTMRCTHPSAPHPNEEFPLPVLASVEDWRVFASPSRRLTKEEVAQLKCPLCMSQAQPNEYFPDDDRAQLAASDHAARLVKSCSLLLLVGCTEESALEKVLIQSTRDNNGRIIRAGTPIRTVDVRDPSNTTGISGIREMDINLLYDGVEPVGVVRDRNVPGVVEHTGRVLADILDAAEEVAGAEGVRPASYTRLSL